MSLHFFAIPALDSGPAQEECNRFCAAHRVVTLEKHFVVDGAQSYWTICVTVASGAGPLPDSLKVGADRTQTQRIDYKTILSEADFAAFAELRAWRKTMAEQEGVPVYAVFTNEQLAAIVRRRVHDLSELGAIDGIGAARLDRYGEAVLARLATVIQAQTSGD